MQTVFYIIAAVLAVAFLVIMFIFKRNTLKKWLLEAVTAAETEIGVGHGQDKLRLVHDRLVQKFPLVGKVLPFKLFSKMVDSALEIMREKLKKGE